MSFSRLDENFAHELDHADSLASFRTQFFIPRNAQQQEKIYFCGNSLGLQPITVTETINAELTRWQKFAVEAHFEGEDSWYTFQNPLREILTQLIGAGTHETVIMNSLTVNLHLLLCSFYRPTPERHKILIMDPTFPSDRYAMQTFLALKGYDPHDALLTWNTQADGTFSGEELENFLHAHGEEIALIWFEGVNYLNGQAMDIEKITALGHKYGCTVGWDLAHAVGNILLDLHAWKVDFAVWCSYKYLNAGPGATAGCFVHEKHLQTALPQLAGWWGVDPKTRFKFEKQFVPHSTADRWQLSNPAILAMTPLKDSLRLFSEATLPALRAKSYALTDYLRFLLASLEFKNLHILTPATRGAYGCQLSIALSTDPTPLHQKLTQSNLVCDFREPNIFRLAPVPLYNRYHEVWQAVNILREAF